MRNQTDAVYLNGQVFSDFGPKLDIFGGKRSENGLILHSRSEFERNGIEIDCFEEF